MRIQTATEGKGSKLCFSKKMQNIYHNGKNTVIPAGQRTMHQKKNGPLNKNLLPESRV